MPGPLSAPTVLPPNLLVQGAGGFDERRRLAGKPPLEIAREFEAMLLAQVIGAMRRTIPESGLLAASTTRRVLDGAFDHEVAASLLRRHDLGLARTLVRQLEKAPSAPLEVRGTTPASAEQPAADGEVVLPVDGRVTSEFGRRVDPISGQARFHSGIDLAAPMGSEVRAAGAGEVVFSGARGTAGNIVTVRHGDLVSSYAHLGRTLVREGQQVFAGQVIATVGSSGRSTGPHLHFAVARQGRVIDPAILMERDSPGPAQRSARQKT